MSSADRPSGQQLICITAGQRAGTTALQRALGASGRVRNFGEIFQTRNPNGDPHGPFLKFIGANDIRLVDAMTSANVNSIAAAFLQDLQQQAGDKHVLVDVKLNSWLALSPAWHYSHEEPFFLKFLKRNDATIIFVWRRNLAEQVLSAFISQELGIWHNIDAESVAGRTIDAPIARVRRAATMLCLAERDMHAHLAKYQRKVVIAYEDLFIKGELSPQFRKKFIRVFGEELDLAAVPGIRPNSVPKNEIVTNYERALNAVSTVVNKYRQIPDLDPADT